MTRAECVVPYGWGGADNPVSTAAKFFEATSFDANTPGAAVIAGNSTAGAVVADEPSVLFASYDSTDHGGQFNQETRLTRADTDVPSGDLVVSGDIHSIYALLAFPFELTPSQRAMLFSYLQSLGAQVV